MEHNVVPNVMLFVEDEVNEAYEILVRKVIGLPLRGATSVRVRAARARLDELTNFTSLLDLTQRAQRAGFQQVVFVMDHEGPGADRGRVNARQQFRDAFQELCDYIDNLPPNDPLHPIHLVRIEVHTCLETWLLSDPPAIAYAAGDSNYTPRHRRTHHLTPREAREAIAHILREVGRRRSKRHLQKLSGTAVKSWGKRIASVIDIEQARRFNFSLDYFCRMIETTGDGCEQPFPDPP